MEKKQALARACRQWLPAAACWATKREAVCPAADGESRLAVFARDSALRTAPSAAGPAHCPTSTDRTN